MAEQNPNYHGFLHSEEKIAGISFKKIEYYSFEKS